MKKLFFTFGLLAGLACFTAAAHAADLTVSPAVIDAHGLPRDILSYSLNVMNTSGQAQNVFASVYELTADGKQAFSDPAISNRQALLADWIQVSRGSMLFQPGETKTIPVTINIHPSATSGEYHAVIAFVEGGIRDDAEQHLNGAPQALINMTVESDAKEILQLNSFSAAKSFYSRFPVVLNYVVENIGNIPSTPTGLVLFYDKSGHEIGSVDANPGGITIAPGEKHPFSVEWKDGPSFGRYKAVLDLSYGAADGKLENVAFFWILPWQKLLIIFGILFLLIIIFAILIHREYEKRHYRRTRMMEYLLKNKSVVDLRHPKNANE